MFNRISKGVLCVFWSYNLTSGFACVNANQVGVLCGDYKVRFTCPEEWCSSEWHLQAAEINVIFFVGLVWVYDIYVAVHLLLECRTPWFDRDNPGGQGDYETLSLTLVTYPLQVCSQPIAIEVATISGTPVLPAGNNFQVYDNVLFSMLKSFIYIVRSRDNALIPQIFVHAPYPVCTSQISELQI